jgi:SAM-dependent methyltransferase
MTSSRPISSCQICRHDGLDSVLFVGFIPPVNTMPDVGSVPVEQAAFPLEMVRCPACGHVQIGLEVDAEVLFPFSYPYLSGSTRVLRENFADLYVKTMAVLPLAADDLVVDIGSNDGTLLGNFLKGGHRVLGIEPSQAGLVAREWGVETLTGYFNQATVAQVLESHGKARVITAANVFAHIAEPHGVVAAITDLLAPDGLFISESHYLLALVETVQYDTIYHEHLRYYHLGSLIRLLAEHGLEVFKVERIPTHGGSVRVFSARQGTCSVDASVAQALAAEAAAGLDDGSGLKTFRDRVIRSKVELFELLAPLKRAGARIYGIGAPSRASTLINYTGLDDGILDCVLEISTSHKLNKYIPGTRIPVLDEKKLFEDQPEYALLLSWHITEELVSNLKSKGFKGKFISPLPAPRIID